MGAGFIETPNQRIALETQGQALDPGVLGQVEVAQRTGLTVRLADVARVVEAGAPRFGEALIQGRPGVLVTMLSQYGANTMEVTQAVERALDDMGPVFEQEGVTLYPRLHRPATFIETALRNLRWSLLLGGVLVALVLFAFLGHTRTALISLTAIPLSLLSAVIVLTRMGFTLNTMTLGGLAIAIGEVVDDGIIDVENIVRRLRENEHLGRPRSPFRVVLEASLEVRSAVVFATLVVVTVFLPVLTLTGLQGSFFAPLALAYILAILASLCVALTVTPALSLAVFSRGVRTDAEPRLQRWIKAGYRRWLARVSTQPRRVIAAVALLCCAALAVLPFFGGEFLPRVPRGPLRPAGLGRAGHVARGDASARDRHLRGAAPVARDRHGRAADRARRAGRGHLGPEPQRVPRRARARRWPRAGTHGRPDPDGAGGLSRPPVEVLTFLGDRIGETITGEIAPVVVNVFGDDLDVLDATARKVAEVLAAVPGAADVVVKSPPGAPRTTMRLRPERLTRLGFRPVDVLDAVQTAYQGSVVAQTHRANQTADVVVILDPASRRDPEAVGSLLLQNADGLRVPLGELADVDDASDRSVILHEGARRRQTVTCNSDPRRGLVRRRRAARPRGTVSMPPGVYAVFGGAAETQAAARTELLAHAAIASVGVVLLLAVGLGSWRNLGLLLVNLPFALVGGVLAVAISGWIDPAAARLSIGTLVGFVTLFGITTRNSIMMVSHFDHLVREEGQVWGAEAALRGATERVVPILMTAIVTALGLLPLALGSGQAGREIEGPMAIVILGGLVTSTALNLLVLPTLAVRWGRFERQPDEADAGGTD